MKHIHLLLLTLRPLDRRAWVQKKPQKNPKKTLVFNIQTLYIPSLNMQPVPNGNYTNTCLKQSFHNIE